MTHIENYSPDEMSLKELVQKIRRLFDLKKQWRIVVLVGLLGGILGFGYAYFKKPEYTAVLTFTLEDDKSSSGGLGGALGLASSLGFDLGSGGSTLFSGNNIIEFIKSRRMVEKTLLTTINVDGQKATLADKFVQIKKWRKKWASNDEIDKKNLSFIPEIKRETFSLQKDSILGLMYQTIVKKNLTVFQKDKKVSIITLETKSVNESFSKLFAENLLQVVSEFYVETKSKKAGNNVAILQKQADSVRVELNAAISSVAKATDNTYNLNPAMNIQRVPSSKRQIDLQANTVILTELVKNLELAKVTLRKETPLVQIIDNPRFPLKKEKLGEIKISIIAFFGTAMLAILVLAVRRWLRLSDFG